MRKFKFRKYETEDVEKDVFNQIEASINDKLGKGYVGKNVHLCVLCVMNLSFWVYDEYDSETQSLLASERENLFDWIEEKAINSGKFGNVFLIFPDSKHNWWVWDVKSKFKAKISLSKDDILGGKIPFWMDRDTYTSYFRK